MRESMIHSLRSSFNQGWGGLPIGRKLIIGAAAAAVVAGIIGIVMWSGRQDYSVLFSDLSPGDMQTIEDELYAARVPFKQSTDGSALLVPSSEVYKMRMRLASKGLPEVGAVGFEGFDKTDFGMTDFVQQLKYQRALQVELMRTIIQINEVSTARVHIVLPRQTVFTEKEQPAKASVVLNLHPGARLDMNQVDGIVHLVASAVEGLKEGNVTVLDTSGKMLSRASEETFVETSQLEYQRSVESTLESQVQNMLDKVLGPSKAAIQVAAELDFSKIETTSEVYDPEKSAVKSEQSTEYSSKGMAGAMGIPGVASNITPNAQGEQSLPEYNRSDATTQYELSKTVQRVVKQPGEITKLSVAVVVDNKMVDGKSVPRTQNELKDIESLVRNAVGVDTSRGDPQIEVRNIPFDTSLQDETAAAEKVLKREQLKDMVTKAVIAIAVVVFSIFALRSISRRRPAREIRALPESKARVLQLEEPKAVADPLAVEAALQRPLQHAQGTQAASKGNVSDSKNQIMELLEKDPEVVARRIREWLSESSSSDDETS